MSAKPAPLIEPQRANHDLLGELDPGMADRDGSRPAFLTLHYTQTITASATNVLSYVTLTAAVLLVGAAVRKRRMDAHLTTLVLWLAEPGSLGDKRFNAAVQSRIPTLRLPGFAPVP